MELSTPFILRPIATTLMALALTVLGALGYRLLPISALPEIDFPTIEIRTSFPGASPDVIESTITAPLEHFFGQIAGLTSMSSTSSLGSSQIVLQFALSKNIDTAAQDVQAAISAATGWLPASQLPTLPAYRKVNPTDSPVLVLGLTSDILLPYEVNDYASRVVAQKLSQVNGVGAVWVEGGSSRALRIDADPNHLAGLDLSLEDLRSAISANTVNNPKGSLDGARQSFQIGANDQLLSPDAWENAVIAYRRGAPVFLRDVAHASDGLENAEVGGLYNGHRAVILTIQRQPGTNVIEVADAVKKLLPTLRNSLPSALHIDIINDRTVSIRAAISEVQMTLILTVFLVVFVIFLFLRKAWITIIPSVTLPLSIIATFGLMHLASFNLDNLSLMALTIASGFVVDDAIVMIENIVRYIEEGDPPLAAAIKGARQIGFTVISLTISLVAVFIPLLLMGGVIGRLFREFAITMSAAIIISAILSLTLTPMMCATLLSTAPRGEGEGRRTWSERAFETSLNLHRLILTWVMRHQRATLLTFVLSIAVTFALFDIVKKGFLPQEDTGLFIGITDAAPDISFQDMNARQDKVAKALLHDPDVRGVASVVGVGQSNSTINTGRLYITTSPPDERTANAHDLIVRLERAATDAAGINLHLQAVQDIQIETRTTRTTYQYVLQSLDNGELQKWVEILQTRLRAVPELSDVTSDQQNDAPQVMIRIDRRAASRLGISLQSVDDTLNDAFAQRQIATIYSPLTQYHVILEVAPEHQNDPLIFEKLYVTSSNSQTSSVASIAGTSDAFTQAATVVPLSAIATIEHNSAPLLITHQGLFPSATISFNVAQGHSLDQALAALYRTANEIRLPDTISASVMGQAAEFSRSLASEPALILAAIVTVYIVLGVLYESYIHPITILSALPSAGVGALLAIMLCGLDLNLISLIGIILLIGIVKKNAIMIVDFALQAERRDGLPPERAIIEASILRFRPIMMTTMAALLGALPLALASGTGAAFRQTLGITIIGGLILSQFIAVYMTPVVYLACARLQAAVFQLARPELPPLRAPVVTE